MERTAVRGRLNWLVAEVVDLIDETGTVKSIVLDCPDWPLHLPGQHVDIRLTAEDGYQAQRSYSIANPPAGEKVVVTVELVDDGEVSPYLIGELAVGDQIELRGPIGGYFVWTPEHGGPVQLVAGGSGLVPLMAMIRALAESDRQVPVRLLTSARSRETLIYGDELRRLQSSLDNLEVAYTLTRAQPADWQGYSRRVDQQMLAETSWPATERPLGFVCGPTGFVETVAANLVALGHDAARIKTERFGPSGG
ncbi:MAG: ferredoxin reductase [Acidimicrobiia bacterium]